MCRRFTSDESNGTCVESVNRERRAQCRGRRSATSSPDSTRVDDRKHETKEETTHVEASPSACAELESKHLEIKCRYCGSGIFWRDGIRHLGLNHIQRYLCLQCGRRFSEPKPARFRVNKKRRVRETPQEKRLSQSLLLGKAAGDEGRIAQYEWKCRKRQLQRNTIELRKYHLSNLVKDGADLNNPESVETVLATKDYPTATKWLVVEAYHSYCKLFGIQWEKLKIKYQPKMPYIPTEQENLLFIGALSGKTISIVCRTLFETGCRIGELHAIERTDVNEEACIITIQHPEKNSNPRALKVSAELIGLLKALPLAYGNHLFNPKNGTYDGAFHRQRRRAADRLGKPQFLKIHFHTFRHTRASIDIANGVPLFEVKQNLGHKSILNTEKYVHWNRQLYHEKNERYYYKAVSTDEEAGNCIEEGMQYVCTNPTTLRMLFRKAK